MAIKLRGIAGETLLQHLEEDANGPGEQDFLLTNYPVFFGKDPVDYARFIAIITTPLRNWRDRVKQRARLFVFFILEGRFRQLWIFAANAAQRIDSPFSASYFSMTPYRLGDDLVVRYAATPAPNLRTPPAPDRDSPSYLREAMAKTLETSGDLEAPVIYNFSAQFRAQASADDVEDASRAWQRPQDTTVALGRIEISRQDFEHADRLYDCETLSFNPWRSLPQHRPLGGLNRMRLAVYLASLRLRHRLNMQPGL
jgi:hypothetical protein